MRVFAQGDVLLVERHNAPTTNNQIAPESDGAIVLAHGEVSGHRHLFDASANVAYYHDAAMAFDATYQGTLIVDGPSELKHDEHDTINIPPGNYDVRKQRSLSPKNVSMVAAD